MSLQKAVIVGAGGHGRVILDILQETAVHVVGFLDDQAQLCGQTVDGVAVLGPCSMLSELRREGVAAVLGIGDNGVRARFYEVAKESRISVLNAIHPRAVVSKRAVLGEGTVIMAGAVVGTGSQLGANVCVNTGATVDHDNVLADHVHVYPGAHLTGGARVGRFSYISSGAVVAPYITIGENVTVTAGAVVLKDVPDNVLVGGVPAKVLREKEPGTSGRLR